MKTLSTILFSAALTATACGGGDSTCEPGPGQICTIAGNGDNFYGGDGGPALDASFSLPMEMMAMDDGSVLVLDWNNHRLRRVNTDGTIEHVAGRGELGGTLDDPALSDFNHPTGLLLDPDGRTLYIVAWHNSKIRSVDLQTKELSEFCGDGRRAYFGDGGPCGPASFDLPTSAVFDPDGNMVVMDQANQVIRKIDMTDDTITRMAGVCVAGPGACAPGAELFQCPNDSGKMHCGDPLTCSEPCEPSYGGDEGPAIDMRISQPFGQSALPGGRLLYDPDGNLYFADSGNNLIRMIDTDGIVHLVAGTPPDADGKVNGGYAGDGGPATEALLRNPVDLAMGDDGTLYFSDVDNHCIRAIDPAGTINTVVGVCGTPGYEGDGGPPTEALLKYPFGIDLHGNDLYIADMGNSVIREVVLQ